jgi:hypothetical protein
MWPLSATRLRIRVRFRLRFHARFAIKPNNDEIFHLTLILMGCLYILEKTKQKLTCGPLLAARIRTPISTKNRTCSRCRQNENNCGHDDVIGIGSDQVGKNGTSWGQGDKIGIDCD